MYLTLAVDEDAAAPRRGIDAFLEQYYDHRPPRCVRGRRLCRRPGRRGGVACGLCRAGATHLVLRFAGEHERHLETLAGIRAKLGW